MNSAISALIVANVVWGTSFVATKPLLDVLPAASIAVGRCFFALVVLLPVLLLTGRRIALGWVPAILGSTGVVLTVVLQNLGLERTSAANASCLSGAVPAMAVVLAYVLLRQSPRRAELAAVGLSLAGVVAIVIADGGAKASFSPAGDALILASAASLAMYLVLGSRYFAQIDAVSLVAGSSLYGLLFLTPFAGYEATQTRIAFPDAETLLMLVYLGAGASALAYCLEGCALSELGSGQVAMFGNLVPAIGVVASALFLGETISLMQGTGAVLVVAGAWLTTRDAASVRRRPAFLGGLLKEAIFRNRRSESIRRSTVW
ncbi:MAG: DMT family transporter [Thermomicrobiales bacterium]